MLDVEDKVHLTLLSLLMELVLGLVLSVDSVPCAATVVPGCFCLESDFQLLQRTVDF